MVCCGETTTREYCVWSGFGYMSIISVYLGLMLIDFLQVRRRVKSGHP